MTTPIRTCHSSSVCSGSARTAIAPPPRNVAQAFADYLNSVLNATVSDARLTLVAVPGQPNHFTIACLDEGRPIPFALHGSGLRLLFSQTVEVDDEKCHTVTYAYRLATSDEKDSWVVRWEYFRNPPRPDYPYPLAHLHVNAILNDAAVEERLAKPAPHLHVPTARVALELVLQHLIAEWGVQTRTSDWQAKLSESLSGFEERRTAP